MFIGASWFLEAPAPGWRCSLSLTSVGVWSLWPCSISCLDSCMLRARGRGSSRGRAPSCGHDRSGHGPRRSSRGRGPCDRETHDMLRGPWSSSQQSWSWPCGRAPVAADPRRHRRGRARPWLCAAPWPCARGRAPVVGPGGAAARRRVVVNGLWPWSPSQHAWSSCPCPCRDRRVAVVVAPEAVRVGPQDPLHRHIG